MCVCVCARVVCDGHYVEPNDAREMLDNLKMMCPPPTGCKSLDYLRAAMSKAKFEEGAYVRELQWDKCGFEVDCSPINITVGDAIIFKYSASHDVVKVATAAEYAGCTALTNVVGSTSEGASGYKTGKFDKVGTHYFVCGRGTHCKQGQKTVVHVHEARKVPSTGGAAPSYSNGDSKVEADSSAAVSSHNSFAAAILGSVLAAVVLVLA